MTVALLAKWGDQPPGTLYTSDSTTEAAMVTARVATATLTGAVEWVRPGNSPGSQGEPFSRAESAAIRGVVSKDGNTGVWRQVPAAGPVMRVRMTGSGTVSMDSATGDLGAGTVTTAAYTATVAGTQIDDYAYPGDAARSIRFTLTGTAAVEVY